MAAKLVIVESPAKARKIQEYLPKGFQVEACVGHIRDLPNTAKETPSAIKDKPWADLAVDVEHDFEPHYVVKTGKSKVISELKRKLKEADELYLATDEDREGESISWHLKEVLSPKVPVKRMVFNEITKRAIQHALENPRDLDMQLVEAQETRRILDRLFGYTLSPLLWKKIAGGLSAGRVQSVAVRLVVERERERRSFRKGAYWDLVATLAKSVETFEAKLDSVAGKRVATAKDFDKDTGRIADGVQVLLLDEAQAKGLEARLAKATWTVATVDESKRTSSPPAPFTTAALQQEANNRLNLSAGDAMRVAQQLYEQGFITYHRTDSTALSEEGTQGARAAVKALHGEGYLPPSPRRYESKGKGAQEAHEAIRPAGEDFVLPGRTGLAGKQLELYDLIFRRTLASQMVDERYTSTTVLVRAEDALFRATGKRTDFAGWRAAYPVKDEGGPLPKLAKDDTVDCRRVEAQSHETKPPARFTEASLVAALEKEGIGRPSTYAAIMETIKDKGYVVTKGKALVPTFTAFAVTGFLEKHFPELVDLRFTARMEATLDEIAAGETESKPYLKEFYAGPHGLAKQVEAREGAIDPAQARIIDLPGLPGTIRVGRYGPYIEASANGDRISVSIPEDMTPGELDEATVERLLKQAKEGPESLGKDPATGEKVYLLTGRYGPYVQRGEGDGKEKPPRASIPRNWEPSKVTLDDALFLLSLPRELGKHPEGGRVLAGLGRFGPYVAHEKGDEREFRSLQADDDLRSVTLDRALDLLSQPKGGRGGARGQPKVLKDLGEHEGKPLQVLAGRYGPYVKHDQVNATIPKDVRPEDVTKEQALALVKERRAKGPAKKRGRRRSG